MKNTKYILMLLLCNIFCFKALSQTLDSTIFVRDYAINEESVGQLSLQIDNVSFFKDNEWEGNVVEGYTLPGLWVQPKVSYTAIPELQLEAGLHALIFSGTTKYPNTIYQDIAEWKGDQYTSGTHLLPFFRANIKLGNLHFVLGNIYGGSNHRLSDALFSSELNLISDPETGLQMLFDSRRLHFDVWANWQSFIFKGDNHRESFVFGTSAQYKLTNELTSTLGILAHHRGGEINTGMESHVNTVTNGVIGLRYTHPTQLSWMRSWSLGADLLGYYQQVGQMWPIDKGWALYAEGRVSFPYGLNAKVGYQMNRDFISILSYPYYGCLSLYKETPGATFKNPQLINAQVDWTRPLSKNYAVGIRAEMFQYIPNKITDTNGMSLPEKSTTSFSFGIFLKANPVFLLHTKK